MAEPHLALSDEMIERAVLVGSRGDSRCPDGTPCTHTACHYRAILEAAFEGVPITNYGIGLCLQFFDVVICVKERGLESAAGVYVSNGPDGFDALDHHLGLSWAENPRRLRRIDISGIAAPCRAPQPPEEE